MRQSGVVVHAATVKVPNFSMRSECRGNRAVRKCCTFLGAHLTISFQNRQRDHYLRSNGACNDFQPKKKTSLLFGFQTAQCSGVTPSNNRSDEDKKEDNCCSNALLEDTNQPQFLSSLQIKSLVPSLTTRILEEFWGSLGGGFDGRGFWSEMQRKERLSQLFRVSLIFSLGMANPWMGSASAITSKEWVGELHASAILQPYESNKIGSPLHSYHMGDTRAASGWLSQEDELPGKTFSLNINENRPLKLQSKEMFQVAEASKVCEETYGFLPCSDSVGGNLALIVAYGYLLLIAAQLISKGSELLLEVMNPGLIGGLLLPILGSLPDALLIFASGSGGTLEEAQEEVMVGVGVLAGSIVMLLTVGWAGSLYAGRCDLSGPEGVVSLASTKAHRRGSFAIHEIPCFARSYLL